MWMRKDEKNVAADQQRPLLSFRSAYIACIKDT